MDSVLIVAEDHHRTKASDVAERLSAILDLPVASTVVSEASASIPKDADRIVVVPLVPSDCAFVDSAIPSALGIDGREGDVDVAGRTVRIMVTDPFGTHARIRDALYDHVIPLEPEPGATCIVVTGVVDGDRDDTAALKEWAALIRGFNIDAFYAFDGGEPSPESCFEEMIELGYRHMVVAPTLPTVDTTISGIHVVTAEEFTTSDGVIRIMADRIHKATERGTVIVAKKNPLGTMNQESLNGLVQRLKNGSTYPLRK